jgi:tetratricopeptide (TPR) repeat protein
MEYNLFDVRTERAIAAGILKETYDEKFGGDKECGPLGHKLSDLPTPNVTVDELAARLATKLVAKISRMKLARMIKLDEGGNRMVKQGVELAKVGHWEEAVEIWRQAIHDEPGNAAAYYNLGVAFEGIGDMKNLRMAGELYKKAVSLRYKKLYREAAARIQLVSKQSHND